MGCGAVYGFCGLWWLLGGQVCSLYRVHQLSFYVERNKLHGYRGRQPRETINNVICKKLIRRKNLFYFSGCLVNPSIFLESIDPQYYHESHQLTNSNF